MENNKITLEDLKNNNGEEKLVPSKEEIVVAKATSNAEAYKKRKLEELKQEEKERKEKAEIELQKENEEHMKKVLSGEEPALSTREAFATFQNDMESAVARKKFEKELIDETIEEQRETNEELEQAERVANGEVKLNIDLINDEEDLKDIKDVVDDLDDEYIDSVINDDDDIDLDDDLDDIDNLNDIDDDDDDIDEKSEENKPDIEYLNYTESEYRKALGAAAKEKIRPIEDDKIIDLSQFTIADKQLGVNKVLKMSKRDSSPNESNWGLFNTGISILMEEFKGQELGKLIELISDEDKNLSVYNRNRAIYKLLFDHDNSEGKPESFTQWLKEISVRDNDNLYMSVYRSSFSGANYIPYNCTECGNVFVSDNVPLYQMARFKSDKDDSKAQEILDSVTREPVDLPVVRKQISENYVMDFKDPSLYNIMIETALLDDDFMEQRRDLITYISYIKDIYYINRETMTLEPIELTKYDKNLKKELAIKIKRYSKILKGLTTEQLSDVQSHINDLIELKTVDVEYLIPETVCPRCGKPVKEVVTSAQNLVFTRHQLALLATM